MRNKYVVRFSILLSLTLLLALLSTNLVGANPPEPPALSSLKLALENPDFSYPPHKISSSQDIGTSATSVFYPSDDAPVQQGDPNATAPNNFYLGTGYYNGFPYGANGLVRSYIKFDLSGLPAVDTIASATLRVYHAGGGDFPGQTRTTTFYRVTGNWNETNITWNNKPAYAEAVDSVNTTYNYQGWVDVDLTNPVRNWVAGSQPNYGLVAIGSESIQGVYRVFASGETDHSPELHINYRPTQPPVLDVWPGTPSDQVTNTQPPFTSTLQISNVTLDSLDWTAVKVGSATWLGLGDSSGSVTPTTPDNLPLLVDPSGLPSGVYTEQIRISSNTPSVVGSPMTATFTLEVLDQLSTIYLPIITKSGGGGGGGSNSPNIVALVVGVADYQYLGPASLTGNLPDDWGFDLKQPGRDSQDFVDLLKNEFGVPPTQILRLGDPSQSGVELATRANFITRFGQLVQMEGTNTIVILFYSGHGGQIPDLNGDEGDTFDEFIAMFDTNMVGGNYERVITDDDLQVLLALLESRHIVVIIDSCYSGGMIVSVAQTPGSGDLLRRGLVNPLSSGEISSQDTLSDLVGPGRLIITGGTGDQSTWESTSLQNGVFTYFFLQGLQDVLHDTNQNGNISFEEAYWFSKDVVDYWIYANQAEHQNPDISDQHFGQVELP